jgi:CheY-like chemotaxis protein
LEASERARNLVTQILTFSRSGTTEIRPIDMGPLIVEGLRLLRATLPSTIEIRQQISSPLPAILAHPTQIHQVLINLCTNAAHAMRAHGGVIEVTLEALAITPAMAALHADLVPGKFVKLTVADTGSGVAPEIVHRIFDPFFTTKKPGEGTGLGLSVVYGIIKGYGGAITVQSERGDGSAFSVYLPALDTPVEDHQVGLPSIPRGTGRVLLVDDEAMLVAMGRELIEDLGYEVTGIMDSRNALDLVRAQPDRFDLVITDMTMPGLTGSELARRLMAIRANIPIILCTGFSELIDQKQAEEAGIRAFVMKPYVIANLTRIIREVLDHH